MQVHPDIAALRSDRAPQRKAQAAMLAARKAWAAEPGAADLQAQLEAYGRGAPLEACPVLEAMFTMPDEAERLMRLLSGHFSRALYRNPFGHPPFRQGFDGVATSILLANSGRAQLILQGREPGRLASPSYLFCDATRLDAVLAGEADARIVRAFAQGERRASFSDEGLALCPGNRLAFDLISETLVIDAVHSRLVILRLLRSPPEPGASREYDPVSGKMLRLSAGSIGTSRREATIALLGRMGRADAAPEIARIARDEGDLSLRWQAMREALALDTAEGFCALVAVARRGDDPLSRQAGALRAQLLEAHPQLARLEAEQCPA